MSLFTPGRGPGRGPAGFRRAFASANKTSYWVGGTGNWSDAANHWANSSGGVPSAAYLPDASTSAVFDGNSGAAAYTVTQDVAAQGCYDLLFLAAPPSGTITFTGSTASFNLNGSLQLLAGMSFSGFATTVNLNGTGGIHTIMTNGCQVQSNLNVNSGTGTFQLLDDLLFNGTQLTMTAGTFDTNGKTVTLNRGSGCTLLGNFTFYNLTRNGGTSPISFLTVNGNLTVTNTFTATGANAAPLRLLIQSNAVGTTRTITAAAVSLINVDFEDITAAGAAAPFTGTSIGDALGNSNITFTAPVSRFWVATTGGNWSATSSWSTSTGGASGASAPLPQDTVTLDANSITSGGRTITLDMPRLGKDLTFSAIANTPTLQNSQATFNFGSLTLGSSMTAALTFTHNLAGRSVHTMTSAAVTLMGTGASFTLQGPGSTYTLQDALTVGGTTTFGLAVLSGTLALNGFTVTSAGRVTVAGGTLSMGASTVVLTGVGNNSPWVYTSGTIIPGTSTVKFTDSSASSKSFAGGGQTYNNIWFSGTGAGVFLLTGANTFNDYKADANLALQFTAGTTTTAATYTIASGCSITSATAANHTLAKTGGPNVKVNALTVSRSTATPANTFYARNGSTDGGNNSGWNFYDPDYMLAAAAGAYTIAGQVAALRWNRRITAAAGAYTIAGSAATLLWGHRLTAVAGAYTMTGNAASLLWGHRLTAVAGAYTIAGQPAALRKGYRLIAAVGAFVLAGQAASLRKTYRLTAAAGTYFITGSDAELTRMLPAVPLSTDQIWYLPSRSTRWVIAPRPTTFVLRARATSYERRN